MIITGSIVFRALIRRRIQSQIYEIYVNAGINLSTKVNAALIIYSI